MTTPAHNLAAQAVPIAHLVASERNPNRMEPEKYGALVRAIREEGFLQPILASPVEDDLSTIATFAQRFWIVDGHHRVRAAAECGYREVPAVVRSMTPHQIQLLRLGMNRLRGELDLAVATDLLQDLVAAGVPHDALWLSGFTPAELEGLLRAPEAHLEDFPAVSPILSEEPQAAERPFVLELAFRDRAQFLAAKRALRKAGGASKDMVLGLLAVLGVDR